MGKFNEEMVKAGVMLTAEGLHPLNTEARAAVGAWLWSDRKLTATSTPT